jgi:hypothetical protein
MVDPVLYEPMFPYQSTLHQQATPQEMKETEKPSPVEQGRLTDFGRTIKPADKVRRDFVLRHIRSRAQIADLKVVSGVVDLEDKKKKEKKKGKGKHTKIRDTNKKEKSNYKEKKTLFCNSQEYCRA